MLRKIENNLLFRKFRFLVPESRRLIYVGNLETLILSTTDPTWSELGWNPGLCNEKLTSKRLGYSTACRGALQSLDLVTTARSIQLDLTFARRRL
jgi:hypothetical protein